jgi:membrane protein
MERLKQLAKYLHGRYAFLMQNRVTTLAGTLVFFLVMSIMPFAVWLTLVFGKLDLPVDKLVALPVFSSVKNMLTYIQKEAKAQSVGASVFLLATSLYSATSLFYHMRKSGEIIYGYRRKKSGWKIRLSALVATFAVMIVSVLSIFLAAGGMALSSALFSRVIAAIVGYLWLFAISFFTVLLLNAYLCPYRAPIKSFVFGSLATSVAWAVAIVGFSVYLKFSSAGKLYGALSTVIVFMLWLYVLMICFVAGAIFCSERVDKRKKSKKL